MPRMRLLDTVLPFSLVVPEVEFPYQRVATLERAAFTFGSGLLFLILSEVSLSSVSTASTSVDPISKFRPVLAASHGTPAELGVLPIVLSGMFFQILAAYRKLNLNLDIRKERALFQSLQKITALIISLLFSLLLAFSPPFFGDAHYDASLNKKLILFVELFLGSATTIYLDEIVSKGYGFGSGTLLFSLISISQRFVCSLIGLDSVQRPNVLGLSSYGVIPNLFFNFSSRSWNYTLESLVFRDGGSPTLIDAVVAVGVFLSTLYLSSMKFNLQVRSTKARAQSSSFPVKLVYSGAQPLLLTGSVLSAYLLVVYSLNCLLGPQCVLCSVLGKFDANGNVVSGLAALLYPTFKGSNPVFGVLKVLVYPLFVTAFCSYTGALWANSSGNAPQDIAKIFKDNSIVLVGKRETSAIKELKKVIPMAAAVGGGLVGALASLVDVIIPVGWGFPMVIAGLNLFAAMETLSEEGAFEGGIPGF